MHGVPTAPPRPSQPRIRYRLGVSTKKSRSRAKAAAVGAGIASPARVPFKAAPILPPIPPIPGESCFAKHIGMRSRLYGPAAALKPSVRYPLAAGQEEQPLRGARSRTAAGAATAGPLGRGKWERSLTSPGGLARVHRHTREPGRA